MWRNLTDCNHYKKSLNQPFLSVAIVLSATYFVIYKLIFIIKMGFLFTSESVSAGHPDKVSDQISDAILDEFLRYDPNSKVACETLCTTGLVVVSGEVRSSSYVDIQSITRSVINKIGYNKSEYQFDGNSCGVISATRAII